MDVARVTRHVPSQSKTASRYVETGVHERIDMAGT